MKKALAIIIAALMLVAVFCAISVSAEENELLKIEVTDDSIIITAEGDFGYTDWIAAVWYRRRFRLDASQTAGRVLLPFGAIDYH